jgi:transcriptional regulator with GAF, ATPase, and Fis domain
VWKAIYPQAELGISMSNDDSKQAQNSGGDSIDASVARDLSELSRTLEAADDSAAVMHRIVLAAVHEINGASSAAITLLDHGKITSPAHSDDVANLVGSAQEHTGEGPCVDTSRDEMTLRSDDLGSDDRWPRWGAVAVENGIFSVMSFQLFVEHDSMGALDVYGDTPNCFDQEAENTGLLLASHAAIAMAGIRKIENLRTAVESRDLIGQAKGILMERYKISAGPAFDLIMMSSQATHQKLRVVADRLVATGELDLPPRGRHGR